jgi:ankyrin repeat protein
VRLLLSAGADVSIITRGGKTALQLARTEEVENVFLEHEMAKRPATAQGTVGTFASESAADEPQIGVSESQSGLSVSVSEEAQSNPGPLSTKTANASFFLLSPASEQAAGWKLVKAGEDGDTAAISHMLTHGALVDARNKIGRTALIGAAERGCLASVTTLLSAGATVNLVGDDGECALFKAATNGYTDVVRKLLEAGANVDQANKHNMTPLAAAVANCRPPTVFALLEHHPNIDFPNRSGRTPLIWAGWAGDMSIMSALLAANPPPTLDAVDEDGLVLII